MTDATLYNRKMVYRNYAPPGMFIEIKLNKTLSGVTILCCDKIILSLSLSL